jgi:hypothetical protein
MSQLTVFRYHHIFLKTILDYHQLGRNRHALSVQALSQSTTQPRNVEQLANEFDTAAKFAGSLNESDVHARSSAAASGLSNGPSLHLSRVIGEQDAADRLRAAAAWIDARPEWPCGDDLPLATSASGRRHSIAEDEDDVPLVQVPQHLLAAGVPSRPESMPAVAQAMQGRAAFNEVVGSSGGALVSNVSESSHQKQHRTNVQGGRHADRPSVGQKRPAPDSLGSSASNAILIDDD